MPKLHLKRLSHAASQGICLFAALLFFLAISARAAVTFHTSSGSFNSATASFTLLGTEDWSESTSTVDAFLNDPLGPDTINSTFPNGTKAVPGVKVQSNSLGNNPANTAPGNGLFFAPTNFSGASGNKQPSNQVSANATNDSFDIILTNNAKAVALNPTYYRILSANNSATLVVRVYNQSNVLVGTTTVPNVQDCLETAYLGIVASGSDTIGRINIWATPQDVSGADNISVYLESPDAPPTLEAIRWLAGNFTLKLNGMAGRTYAIHSSTNFVNWQLVQNTTLVSNSIQLTVSAPDKNRFYRAQLLQGGVPVEPTLQAIIWAGGNFTFKLNGEAGKSYEIQSTTNFVNWVAVQTNSLTSNSLQITVSAPDKQRFFRARVAQ